MPWKVKYAKPFTFSDRPGRSIDHIQAPSVLDNIWSNVAVFTPSPDRELLVPVHLVPSALRQMKRHLPARKLFKSASHGARWRFALKWNIHYDDAYPSTLGVTVMKASDEAERSPSPPWTVSVKWNWSKSCFRKATGNVSADADVGTCCLKQELLMELTGLHVQL